MKQEKNWLIHSLIGTFGASDQLVLSQRKVLFYIALKGKPTTKYSIEKETRINHASVHEAVNELEKGGALKSEEIGQSRARQAMRQYSLTRYGAVLAILQFHFWPIAAKEKAKTAKNISNVAENWKYLEPILFGKWEYLEQVVGKGVGVAFLILTAFNYDENLDPEENRQSIIRECFDSLENSLMYYNYIKPDQKALENYSQSFGSNVEEFLDSWVKAIRNDSALNKYFEDYTDFLFEEAEGRLRWCQFLKKGPEYAAKWLTFQS
jgi:hypothetical protein